MPTPGVAHPESKSAESSAGQYGRSGASLELSDTNVYEPQIRALLGTASHFCEVVVLKLRTVNPNAYTRRGASGVKDSRK